MKDWPRFKRGEVWLGQFLPPDEPNAPILKFYLILQEGRPFDSSSTVTVAVLTTQRLERKYPTEVFIPPNECHNGKRAKVMLDQLYTVPKNFLLRCKYRLSRATMRKINFAIQIATGLIKIEEIESVVSAK